MKEKPDTIAIVTLGCKVNQAESEELAGSLQRRGYAVSHELRGAALCVVNTCTVTAEADHKSRKAVNRALRAGIPVIATGCTVEANSRVLPSSDEMVTVPKIAKDQLLELIGRRGLARGGGGGGPETWRARAVIKVQDGCDGRCAYCIVKRARGASRSRPRPEIDAAVSAALARGAVELVLAGVNLGDYGQDGGTSLAELVRELTLRPDVGRVRLSSLEIEHLKGPLLYELAENPKVCKHLHLPLQSGDDVILASMRRRYTAGDALDAVNALRRSAPDTAITLDIMAGFPGEGEREFAHTLQVIEELRPAKLHVFPFSPRPGTEAAGRAEQVDIRVKRERALRARRIGAEYQLRFVQQQVGKGTEVALLGPQQGGIVGLTGNYVKVLLPALDGEPLSGLARVRLVGARGTLALGTWDQ